MLINNDWNPGKMNKIPLLVDLIGNTFNMNVLQIITGKSPLIRKSKIIYIYRYNSPDEIPKGVANQFNKVFEIVYDTFF